MKTFEQCCDYLGISTELPKCQIRERQHQAAYKLSVCMDAWNKQDGFDPDEMANFYQDGVGYTPYFYFKGGRLLSAGNAVNGSSVGIVFVSTSYAASTTYANLGLRLCLKTPERAVAFGKIFIETFNELI